MNVDSVRVDFDPKVERIATSIDVRLSEKLKMKTKYKNTDGVVSTDFVGKQWKIGYDFVKKTLFGQYERKFEGFEVKIKQFVPNMKWSVVPSPELQVETKLVERDNFSDSLELKYDMYNRLAAFEEKLKIGDNHEIHLAVDSASGIDGACVAFKTKVSKPYAKAIGAKYTKINGPILNYAVDPTDRLALKVEAALSSQTVKGELVYKPEQAENAEVGFSIMQPFHSTNKPTTGLFIKWNFDK